MKSPGSNGHKIFLCNLQLNKVLLQVASLVLSQKIPGDGISQGFRDFLQYGDFVPEDSGFFKSENFGGLGIFKFGNFRPRYFWEQEFASLDGISHQFMTAKLLKFWEYF